MLHLVFFVLSQDCCFNLDLQHQLTVRLSIVFLRLRGTTQGIRACSLCNILDFSFVLNPSLPISGALHAGTIGASRRANSRGTSILCRLWCEGRFLEADIGPA